MDKRYQQLFELASGTAPYLQGSIYELLEQEEKNSEITNKKPSKKASKLVSKPLKKEQLKKEQIKKGKLKKVLEKRNKDFLPLVILPNHSNARLFEQIYAELKQAHPKAKADYWNKRIWSLLIWQPLCIGIMSVYGIHAIPSFKTFRQYWDNDENVVAGFQLGDSPMLETSEKKLIRHVSEELQSLFAHYAKELQQQIKLEERLQQRLISDLLIMALVEGVNLSKHSNHANQSKKVNASEVSLADFDMEKQCCRWLKAFGLSERATKNLHHDIVTDTWFYTRQSCCSQYHCDTLSKCDNCPKRKKKLQ